MPDTPQEKTEQPTSKRLRDARNKGQVPQSQEISSAVILLMSLMMLLLLGRGIMLNMGEVFTSIHGHLEIYELSPKTIPTYFQNGIFFLLKMILPFAVTVVIIAFLTKVSQFGFMFTPKPVTPDIKKLNPMNGLKRIFSSRGVTELAKGILKITVIGIIAWLTLRAAVPELLLLPEKPIWEIISVIGSVTAQVALRSALFMLVLGIVDLLFQNWKHKKDLMMSKQEVKDELKQTEGDPVLKGRIREIQMKMSLNRMIDSVPTADVVVTNPTHFAVVLKYDPENMPAPLVVAKGKDKLAEKIKRIAAENDVPVLEEPQLARTLFKLVEIGDEIPYELFQAVAEVLAIVYELKKKVNRRKVA